MTASLFGCLVGFSSCMMTESASRNELLSSFSLPHCLQAATRKTGSLDPAFSWARPAVSGPQGLVPSLRSTACPLFREREDLSWLWPGLLQPVCAAGLGAWCSQAPWLVSCLGPLPGIQGSAAGTPQASQGLLHAPRPSCRRVVLRSPG